MQIYTQALKQFLLKDGPTHRCTPKRNGPKMVFIIPSARREVELRDEKIAGYLAAPHGSTSTPSWSTSRPRRNQGSQTQTMPATRRAENQSTPVTRCLSPSLERCVLNRREFFLSRSSRSTRIFPLRSFYRSRARFAQAWPVLSGWDKMHSLDAQPSESVHDHIWEWNSVRSSLGGTRRIPLLGMQPSKSVHDHIWE